MKNFLAYALLLVTTIFFTACTNNEKPVEVKVAQVVSVNGSMSIAHDENYFDIKQEF